MPDVEDQVEGLPQGQPPGLQAVPKLQEELAAHGQVGAGDDRPGVGFGDGRQQSVDHRDVVADLLEGAMLRVGFDLIRLTCGSVLVRR